MNYKLQKYKTEYGELVFDSEKKFEAWLKKTAKYKIHFEDNGQDCLYWWIDEGGEVLHSNLQSSIWNGKLVSLFELKVGKFIEIMIIEKMANQALNFKVIEIEEL